MQKKRKKSSIAHILLCTMMLVLFSGIVHGAGNDLEIKEVNKDFFNSTYTIRFANEEQSTSVIGIKVGDRVMNKSAESYSLEENSFYIKPKGYGEPNIILKAELNAGIKVVFVTNSQEYAFEVKEKGASIQLEKSFSVNPTSPDEDVPVSDAILSLTEVREWNDLYLTLTPVEKIKDVEKILLNGKEWKKNGSKISTFGESFFVDLDKNRIYIGQEIKSKEIITLKDSSNKVIGKFEKTGDKTYISKPADGAEAKELYARIRGKFEVAVIGQKGYDAVSGATGVSTENKNSNVVLELAQAPEGTTPVDSDYKLAKNCDLTLKKVEPVIEPSDSGMEAKWNGLESRIYLQGTPKKEGTFKVSVKVTDSSGREAETDSLEFKVYDYKTIKLSDVLKKENFTKLQEGNKSQWDMEPWYIELFDDGDKVQESTVRVPASLKLWWGSHQSGTYGSLGYPIAQSEKPNQTLVVPKGAELYLCNMKILSSVKIIVEDGGKLNLYDSSMYGQIIVEDGGIFQMNYDSYKKKFLSGSSIQGQLILKDGATVEDSLIYSNANNLTDGRKAKKIEEPVVSVQGNATISGKVYVRGDEAATGISPVSGKLYQGQLAMEIKKGAKLTISENSELGLYGGGKLATTTNGGNALRLGNNSELLGRGKLIAIGGDGQLGGEGGTAVIGKGKISVEEAYLQGGNVYNDDKPSGKAYEDTVIISNQTIGQAIEGKRNPNTFEEEQNSAYWTGTTQPSEKVLKNSSTQGATKINPEAVEEKYKINVIHGKAEVNGYTVSEAKEGDSVTIRANSAEKGKVFYRWNIKKGSISLAENKNEVTTFIMPKEEVSIESIYRAKKTNKNMNPSTSIPTGSTELSKAYIKGYPDGNFRPNGKITRAEAATLFTRLLGIEDNNRPKEKNGFKDTANHWAKDSIDYMVNNGYLKGYPEGDFRPDQEISRAELTKMIEKYGKKNSSLAPFLDIQNHWAKEAIDQAYGNEIIQGYQGNIFRPDKKITRAETVTILNNLFDRKTEDRDLDNVKDSILLKVFPDVKEDFWAYKDILDGTNTHIEDKDNIWIEVK